MARMRGVQPFRELWQRRTSVEDDSGIVIEILSLPDLVSAKKTQRDKDWPMIRRLIEAHYAENRDAPSEQQVQFWLRESRTPSMLIELSVRFPGTTQMAVTQRPLLAQALAANYRLLEQALDQEQAVERDADRIYWEPLRRELEQLRLDHRKR